MKKTLNYKKLSIHTLLIVAIILLAAVSLQAGFAATHNIDNTTTVGGINGTLNGATPGDTIILDEGIYTGNNNTNITINKNITIQGKTKDKVILDAQGLSRIFVINNNLNVTFINITFTNALTLNGLNGGAIYNNGAGTILTFANCTFIDNAAINTSSSNGRGGAIWTNADNVLMNDCNFHNNNATTGGAIFSAASLFNINNCNFTNNNGTVEGGAIFNQGYLNINNCNFTNNEALTAGGAISSTGTNSVINIINSNFDNCVSSRGGALSFGGNSNVTNCNFHNNNANSGGAIYSGSNLTITECNFIGNIAGTSGGAVRFNGNNKLTISFCNFTNNVADGSGGAIALTADYTFIVNGSTFSNNNATSGGAIYSGGTMGNNTVVGSNFTNNKATDTGGAIRNNAKMYILGNNMVGNSANLGQMIYNVGSMGVLNLTFIGNSTYVVVNGSRVTIYATLTDDMGNTVTGQNINIYINGILGGVLVQNIESIEGNVSFDITVYGADGDLFPVNGTYDGIGDYSIIINEGLLSVKLATDPTPLNLTKIPTNSTISAKDTTVGKQTTIKGIAKDKTGKVLANTKLTVTVDGKNYTVTTNNAGEWSLKYTPTREGSYKVSVTFAGNSTHEGFTNSATFKATKTNNKIPTKITLKRNGNKVTATLTDKDGNPLEGKKIVIRDSKGRVLGFGITNKDGQVTITVSDNGITLKATFAGDDSYLGSTASLTIQSEAQTNENTNNNDNPVSAEMQNTGMPIVAILLVLLSMIGVIYRKR